MRRTRQVRQVATTPGRHAGTARATLAAPRRWRRRVKRDELAQRRAAAAGYRRRGGPRGQRRRFAGRILWQPSLPPIEASTGTLEAVYPFQVASGVGPAAGSGVAVGPSATGGTFTWDPWLAYQQGRLSNPNLLILGEIGSGKSALAKTLIWRGLEFGRGAHIIDPKGEYQPLAEAAGVQPLTLRPGGTTVLNPLDPGVAGTGLSPADLFHRNLACIRALLEATLGRRCRQLELVVVAAALARICRLELASPIVPADVRHGQTATLTMLAEALIDPPTDVAGRTNMDHAQVIEQSRELALAATRLVDRHGDLGGMFAGHTNVDADPLADVTVVDIAEIARTSRAVLPLVMICTAAWLQLATTISPKGRWQLNDEGWVLLSDEATARWMQANMKLSRQLGLAVVTVMHRLSDTAAAGADGTATRALAEGVITDAATWVIYRQKPAERRLLHQILELNDMQTSLACRLTRGRGLWIVGGETRQVALVDHVLSDVEQGLVDTDQIMRRALDHDQPADQ